MIAHFYPSTGFYWTSKPFLPNNRVFIAWKIS